MFVQDDSLGGEVRAKPRDSEEREIVSSFLQSQASASSAMAEFADTAPSATVTTTATAAATATATVNPIALLPKLKPSNATQQQKNRSDRLGFCHHVLAPLMPTATTRKRNQAANVKSSFDSIQRPATPIPTTIAPSSSSSFNCSSQPTIHQQPYTAAAAAAAAAAEEALLAGSSTEEDGEDYQSSSDTATYATQLLPTGQKQARARRFSIEPDHQLHQDSSFLFQGRSKKPLPSERGTWLLPSVSFLPFSSSSRKKTVPQGADNKDWEEFYDSSAGAKYWFNKVTGEATWTAP